MSLFDIYDIYYLRKLMGKDDFVFGVCRDETIIVDDDFFADLLLTVRPF